MLDGAPAEATKKGVQSRASVARACHASGHASSSRRAPTSQRFFDLLGSSCLDRQSARTCAYASELSSLEARPIRVDPRQPRKASLYFGCRVAKFCNGDFPPACTHTHKPQTQLPTCLHTYVHTTARTLILALIHTHTCKLDLTQCVAGLKLQIRLNQ